MMLFIGLLVCLSQAVTFTFNPEDATCSTDPCNDKWVWNQKKTITLTANQEVDIVYDLSSLEGGSRSDGTTTTLGEHYELEIWIRHPDYSSIDGMVITGTNACTDNEDCAYTHTCDPGKSALNAKLTNQGTAQEVEIDVTVSSNDDTCDLIDDIADAVNDWAKTVIIITVVFLVLCILCVVLVCCGVVTCCCNQNKTETVVIEQAKY